jgi:hypothetical protein
VYKQSLINYKVLSGASRESRENRRRKGETGEQENKQGSHRKIPGYGWGEL